jgi:restriction system protein
MAQRGHTRWKNHLTALAVRLHWWLGVLLALISYIGLNGVARQPLPASLPGHVGSYLLALLGWALASVGQYLLPAIFLLGAAVSAIRRRKAERLHEAALYADAVARMSWQDFELLVGEYFRRQGYSVIDNGGGGADGGVDVFLKKGAKRYLVQCKHWKVLRVGVQPVRELYGVMAAQGVDGGFVVTSGSFTEDACAFADGLALLGLIDGRALQRGIRAQAGVALTAHAGSAHPPACPQCGAVMVLRQARQGATAGRQFWGCSRYAQGGCRGTRQLE